jgi:hypothetical protein
VRVHGLVSEGDHARARREALDSIAGWGFSVEEGVACTTAARRSLAHN